MGVKISNLPAIVTPALTDVFPVSQAGVTYKSTLTQLASILSTTGTALTRVNDTNITMTLGGSPTTALVNAASITLGWTGTLAPSRGGTGLSALGAGVATWLGTPSSANLAAAITDETGTGALVFANSPTFISPVLGAATATSITFNPQTGGIVGTTFGSVADAGIVGEFLVSTYASGVAIASNVATNIHSLALTGGDWDIWATATTTPDVTTVQTLFVATLNGTSANIQPVSTPANMNIVTLPFTASAGSGIDHAFGTYRLTVPIGGQIIYLNMLVVYSVSTLTAGGIIVASRRR